MFEILMKIGEFWNFICENSLYIWVFLVIFCAGLILFMVSDILKQNTADMPNYEGEKDDCNS